jgi:hypothetical protein
MTTLLLEDVARVSDHAEREPAVSVRPTLEASVLRAWSELSRRGGTACLACGGQMQALNDTGGAGPIGHCAACGSELS